MLNLMMEKNYSIKEAIGDRGNQGCHQFLHSLGIVDATAKRGKRAKPPPIAKHRFTRLRNQMEGAIGVIKTTMVKTTLRAKTDFGDIVKICKACIGYNLKYAF